MTTPRRIRRRPGTVVFDEKKAKELLQSIAKCDESLAHLQAVRKEQYDKLQEMMVTTNRINVEVGDLVGDIINENGNVQNIIDPCKFYKEVGGGDDFFGCVNVVALRARKVLPERILEKITIRTEGASKGKKLIIWKKGKGKPPRGR